MSASLGHEVAEMRREGRGALIGPALFLCGSDCFGARLSCVIGVEGVDEENDGANTNQKCNKERHVKAPILGGEI
jgi:hypothetical protein